jgi:hypothetical protein
MSERKNIQGSDKDNELAIGNKHPDSHRVMLIDLKSHAERIAGYFNDNYHLH